jgi:hypothetical protein
MKRLLVVTAVVVLSTGGVGCESTHCHHGAPCTAAPICAPVDPCGTPSFTTPSYSTTPGAVRIVQPGPEVYAPAQ